MVQYDVYLVHDGEHGGKQHVTSPVTGTRLDFYDGGVWLTRAEGRNFFPYDQIRTIREHEESTRLERSSGREESNQGSEQSTSGSEESTYDPDESTRDSEDSGGDEQ